MNSGEIPFEAVESPGRLDRIGPLDPRLQPGAADPGFRPSPHTHESRVTVLHTAGDLINGHRPCVRLRTEDGRRAFARASRSCST